MPTRKVKKSLGESLVDEEIITKDQLKIAPAERNGRGFVRGHDRAKAGRYRESQSRAHHCRGSIARGGGGVGCEKEKNHR